MNPTSPFSIEELKTQEERLEILSKKEDLSIGVPKEDPAFEKRVCLTPDAVSALIANNHKVLVESGAGNASSFTDEDYIKAGALVTKFKKEVFECPLVLKVSPPSLLEIELIKPKPLYIYMCAHTHIYMRGVKLVDLVAIMDFLLWKKLYIAGQS